jgi:hypothetical protein
LPLAALFATLLGLVASRPGSAQNATPAAFPANPHPTECQVEPRPIGFFERFVVSAKPTPAATVEATATPFVPPQGTPADPTTVASIEATVREFFACFHAGDVRRYWALFSERLITERFAANPPTAEDLEFFDAEPVPLPSELRITVIAVRDVTVQSDGRVGAFVEYDRPFEPPRGSDLDYLFFIEEGGRFRIDQIVEDLEAQPEPETGTPGP